MFFAPSKPCDPRPFLSHTTNTAILYASGFILVFEFGVHTGNQMMMMVINASLLDLSPSPSHSLTCLCLLCGSHEVVRGLAEAQEEVKEEGVNYVAMRNLFVRESQESMTLSVEKKTRKRIVRESAESLQLDRKVGPSTIRSIYTVCS